MTHNRRTTILLVATVAGVLIGGILGWMLGGHGTEGEAHASWIVSESRGLWLQLVTFPGTAFLNILKMLVLPLVMASMVCGVASLGASKTTGKLGKHAVFYYTATTLAATLVGIALVSLVQPGVGSTLVANPDSLGDLPSAVRESKGALERLLEAFLQMFPPNLITAAADFNILGLIVFSVVLGIAIGGLGETGQPVLKFFEGLNAAIMKIVDWVIWLVPIGALSLVASKLGTSTDFFGQLGRIAQYAAVVLAGVLFHGLVALPMIYWFVTKKNPFVFLNGIAQALLTAFGTASSMATLPLTITSVEAQGVSPRVSRFMLPLGATINMDGTALYVAVSVIWIAQMLGVDLSWAELGIIAFTSTLAAIGAAAIPSAGLVTMVMVLGAVGLAEEGVGFLGFIYAIDWFLDRFRTAVNVEGDAFGAAIVDHFEEERHDPPDAIPLVR